MGEMASFSADYAAAVAEATKLAVIICDRDRCIAAAGAPKRELLEKAVTTDLEKLTEERKLYINENNTVYALEGCDRKTCIAAPIISAGDITGSVVLLENDGCDSPTDTDVKLTEVAAKFLGSRIE